MLSIAGLLASLYPAAFYAARGDALVRDKTYHNPVIPGFHPDPSCILVKEWDNTFFCATSSFNAFPAVPVFASKDLQHWKQIGNVITRASQLPGLGHTNGSTSGIWAPTIRFQDGTFYIVTTLVFDHKAVEDATRWDNILFTTTDPYKSQWSDPVHFQFEGYDTSPYWEGGKTYMFGAFAWRVKRMINGWEMNFETGERIGDLQDLWPGTGGIAPEAPHIYKRPDGYYYLAIAENGTGLDHEVNFARSKDILGSYEPDPANPVLTNARTDEYFQTVGHMDMFQDLSGNWWAFALATRSGRAYKYFPMGRETVLTTARWEDGKFPTFAPVRGEEQAPLPPTNLAIKGDGYWIGHDDIITFAPGKELPSHFVHNRIPDPAAYTVSPPGHPFTLRLTPSITNLTGPDKRTAPTPQTFVARRQEHVQFTFSTLLDFDPKEDGAEAGITVFLNQGQHFDLGVVGLTPTSARRAGYSGPDRPGVQKYLRLRTITATSTNEGMSDPLSKPGIVPLEAFDALRGPIKLEVEAVNRTTYAFRYTPAAGLGIPKTIGYGDSSQVSGGFTGVLCGAFATGNGHTVSTSAYISRWSYVGRRDIF